MTLPEPVSGFPTRFISFVEIIYLYSLSQLVPYLSCNFVVLIEPKMCSSCSLVLLHVEYSLDLL